MATVRLSLGTDRSEGTHLHGRYPCHPCHHHPPHHNHGTTSRMALRHAQGHAIKHPIRNRMEACLPKYHWVHRGVSAHLWSGVHLRISGPRLPLFHQGRLLLLLGIRPPRCRRSTRPEHTKIRTILGSNRINRCRCRALSGCSRQYAVPQGGRPQKMILLHIKLGYIFYSIRTFEDEGYTCRDEFTSSWA